MSDILQAKTITGEYSGFADSALRDVSGTFLTAVPDTYLQNTDLSTTDGKVTAISGIPLSAGGDVPEGVMVESGLEYNAVNEISGYNGSAIAQYGAEKQWLVHDDTLVHAANSAQYALGVNISAIAQLLGVDETVLFSTSVGTSAATLSEPISSFNEIKILVGYSNGSNGQEYKFYPADKDKIKHISYDAGLDGAQYWAANYVTATDTSLTVTRNKNITGSYDASTITGTYNNTGLLNCIFEVIGIGRKQ